MLIPNSYFSFALISECQSFICTMRVYLGNVICVLVGFAKFYILVKCLNQWANQQSRLVELYIGNRRLLC